MGDYTFLAVYSVVNIFWNLPSYICSVNEKYFRVGKKQHAFIVDLSTLFFPSHFLPMPSALILKIRGLIFDVSFVILKATFYKLKCLL